MSESKPEIDIRKIVEEIRRQSMLTPDEIEALRKRAKETSAYCRKAFAHLRPENKTNKPKQ